MVRQRRGDCLFPGISFIPSLWLEIRQSAESDKSLFSVLIPAKIFCQLRSLRVMCLQTRPIVLLLCSPPRGSTIPATLAKRLVDLAALSTALSSATLAFHANGSIAEGGLG